MADGRESSADRVRKRLEQFRSQRQHHSTTTSTDTADGAAVTTPENKPATGAAAAATAAVQNEKSGPTLRARGDQPERTSADLEWWTRLPLAVKVAVWAALLIFAEWANELQAFFVFAGLVLVYAYTRESTRKPGDKSAYSVFNPGCERIDGTFDYDKFEKSLRSGAVV